MSGMEVDAAVRFKIKEVENLQEGYKLAVEMFGKEPDEIERYDGEVEYIRYDPILNDGFTANFPNKVFYIDYIFQDLDEYGFNFDLTQKDFKDILTLFKNKFQEYGIKGRLKVLYYYNGGCAGLSEVE
jgi:hypothetical protein